jgi:hypothetical protein
MAEWAQKQSFQGNQYEILQVRCSLVFGKSHKYKLDYHSTRISGNPYVPKKV